MQNIEVEQIIKQTELQFSGVLKRRIQKIAERLSFKTTLDVFLPDNIGLVIEKEGIKIACIVSVGIFSTTQYDCVAKCMAIGYNRVVVCTTDLKAIENIRNICFKNIADQDKGKIIVLCADRLIHYLKQFNVNKQIKGWSVKVEFRELSENDSKQKISTILRVLGTMNCNK